MFGLLNNRYEGMDMLLHQDNNDQAPTMRIKGTIKEQTNEWIAACRCYAMKPTYVDLEVTLHNVPKDSCFDLSPEAIVSIVRAIQKSKEDPNE